MLNFIRVNTLAKLQKHFDKILRFHTKSGEETAIFVLIFLCVFLSHRLFRRISPAFSSAYILPGKRGIKTADAQKINRNILSIRLTFFSFVGII